MYSIEKYTQEIVFISKNTKKLTKKTKTFKCKKKIYKKSIRFPKKKLSYYEAQKHRFKKLKKKFKKQIKEELEIQLELGIINTNKIYWKRYAKQNIKKMFLNKRKYKLLKIYYDNNSNI